MIWILKNKIKKMVEIVFTNYRTKETTYYKSKWTGMDNQNGLVSVGMDKNANRKVLSPIRFQLNGLNEKVSVRPTEMNWN